MTNCNNCGSEHSLNAKFCPKCGTAILFQEDSKLKGVGGWLIVVIFGLLYSLYNQGSTVYITFSALTDGTIEQLSSITGLAGATTFELVVSTILFGFIIYLLFLIKKEKKNFPKFYIYFLVAATIYSFLDAYIISSLNFPNIEIRKELIGEENTIYVDATKALISSLIWGAYMRRSRRVKLTFVK